MLCPFDASELTVVNRSGIEIDWCPSCKGVWLERGELDKLIDLAAGPRPPTPASPEPGYVPPQPVAQPQPAGYPAPAGYPPASDPRWSQGHDRPRRERWDDDDDDDDDDDRYRRSGSKRKRKSLLSEIFDL